MDSTYFHDSYVLDDDRGDEQQGGARHSRWRYQTIWVAGSSGKEHCTPFGFWGAMYVALLYSQASSNGDLESLRVYFLGVKKTKGTQ